MGKIIDRIRERDRHNKKLNWFGTGWVEAMQPEPESTCEIKQDEQTGAVHLVEYPWRTYGWTPWVEKHLG